MSPLSDLNSVAWGVERIAPIVLSPIIAEAYRFLIVSKMVESWAIAQSSWIDTLKRKNRCKVYPVGAVEILTWRVEWNDRNDSYCFVMFCKSLSGESVENLLDSVNQLEASFLRSLPQHSCYSLQSAWWVAQTQPLEH